MSRMLSLEKASQEWIEKGPLRVWRKTRAQAVSQAWVASLIGRSAQAVRDYESGSYSPNEGAISDLAELLGMKPETLKKKWQKWQESRPTL